MIFDYECLRFIWWALLLVLIIGFGILDGFDLGVAACLKILGRSDTERRVMINTVGPVWESNQAWFVLGGGAIFAAWPLLYSALFSGLYIAMFALLLTFIIRPVAFKFRSKLVCSKWRCAWDYALSLSAIAATLIFGVAIGNIIQGLPFHFDATLRFYYTGSFWGLFNPFALFCGVMSTLTFMAQGAFYLMCKTDGALYERAHCLARRTLILSLICFVIGGFLMPYITGFVVAPMSHVGPSNPLLKTVMVEQGAWLKNYTLCPVLWIAPALAGVCAIAACLFKCAKCAFVASSLYIAAVLSTVAFSLFPFLLPSSTHPSMSLTLWDASSSEYGLFLMLIATVILLPVVLIYVGWMYKVMAGKVTEKAVLDPSQHHY